MFDSHFYSMVFGQLFKTLEGKRVEVEMVNGVRVKGILESSDHFYNFKLVDIEVIAAPPFSEILALKTLFIRGSAVFYVHLPKEEVDLELLRDATRLHNQGSK